MVGIMARVALTWNPSLEPPPWPSRPPLSETSRCVLALRSLFAASVAYLAMGMCRYAARVWARACGTVTAYCNLDLCHVHSVLTLLGGGAALWSHPALGTAPLVMAFGLGAASASARHRRCAADCALLVCCMGAALSPGAAAWVRQGGAASGAAVSYSGDARAALPTLLLMLLPALLLGTTTAEAAQPAALADASRPRRAVGSVLIGIAAVAAVECPPMLAVCTEDEDASMPILWVAATGVLLLTGSCRWAPCRYLQPPSEMRSSMSLAPRSQSYRR